MTTVTAKHLGGNAVTKPQSWHINIQIIGCSAGQFYHTGHNIVEFWATVMNSLRHQDVNPGTEKTEPFTDINTASVYG